MVEFKTTNMLLKAMSGMALLILLKNIPLVARDYHNLKQ